MVRTACEELVLAGDGERVILLNMSRGSKWRWRDPYRRVGELNGLQIERKQPHILPLLLFCHVHNYAGVALAIIRDVRT